MTLLRRFWNNQFLEPVVIRDYEHWMFTQPRILNRLWKLQDGCLKDTRVYFPLKMACVENITSNVFSEMGEGKKFGGEWWLTCLGENENFEAYRKQECKYGNWHLSRGSPLEQESVPITIEGISFYICVTQVLYHCAYRNELLFKLFFDDEYENLINFLLHSLDFWLSVSSPVFFAKSVNVG